MSEANEQTAKSPNAPKADRMAKARAAKTVKVDRISQLEAQVAALAGALQNQATAAVIAPASKPGEYFMGGTDHNGKPVMMKRKWRRSDVEAAYPTVTFAPQLSIPVSPHGVKPVWHLVPGKIISVPSIVKEIHDAQLIAIERQSVAYQMTEAQSKTVFQAAKADPLKGRHFEPLQHLGYGWPIEALQVAAKGKGDDLQSLEAIGWESEIGFPGGYEGKPLPQPDVKKA